MKHFIEEFKAFALKGNVVDLAVGVIIGAAFGRIVTSLVEDVISPVLGLLVAGIKLENLAWVLKEAQVDGAGQVITEAVAIRYGAFLQAALDFIIVAAAIFVAIKVINSLRHKEEKKAEQKPPAPSEEVKLLTEIRDTLAGK